MTKGVNGTALDAHRIVLFCSFLLFCVLLFGLFWFPLEWRQIHGPTLQRNGTEWSGVERTMQAGEARGQQVRGGVHWHADSGWQAWLAASKDGPHDRIVDEQWDSGCGHSGGSVTVRPVGRSRSQPSRRHATSADAHTDDDEMR